MKERLLRLKVKQVIRLDICPGIEYTRLTEQAMISLQGMVHCLTEKELCIQRDSAHIKSAPKQNGLNLRNHESS